MARQEPVLLDGGGEPVGRRENDGPEISSGAVEFEGDVVELHSLVFDAHDATAHLLVVLGIVQQEGLADMQVRAHSQQAAVSVNDLGFGLFLELPALLVLRKHDNGYAQDNAFASPPIWDFGHSPDLLRSLYADVGRDQRLF